MLPYFIPIKGTHHVVYTMLLLYLLHNNPSYCFPQQEVESFSSSQCFDIILYTNLALKEIQNQLKDAKKPMITQREFENCIGSGSEASQRCENFRVIHNFEISILERYGNHMKGETKNAQMYANVGIYYTQHTKINAQQAQVRIPEEAMKNYHSFP